MSHWVFPEPATARLDEILALADVADRAGLDLIGIQDHPYQRHYLDTWMLIATVLARTERVTVFPDVANLPLRPPAVMAKAAASLDVISGGRVVLGVGAGWLKEETEVMGTQFTKRWKRLRETTEAIASSGDVVHRILGAVRRPALPALGVKPGPQPAHDLGIWLGVRGRPYPRPARQGRRRLGPLQPLGSAGTAARVHGADRRRRDGSRSRPRRHSPDLQHVRLDPAARDRRVSAGTVEQWTDELTMLAVEHGIDGFVFGPADDPIRQTQVFAAEVAPAVRDAVARHRHASGTA